MKATKKLTVTPSPHTKSPTTVSGIMLDVIIALVPAAFAGISVFGIRAALLIAACVACCTGFEYGIGKLLKRPETAGDLSAAVTGIILAFSLPVSAPLWICIIGSFIAVIMLKLLWGGIGKNLLNPALTARIILFIAFTRTMTAFTTPARRIADAVSGATPLAGLSAIDLKGDISAQISTMVSDGDLPSLFNMLFGVKAGSIGETCAVALILGGAYLILRGVISITIPASFILTTGAFMLIASGFNLTFTIYELSGGALLLGAFFMATDYTTSPVNRTGKIVFGIGCGLITAILRLFSPLPEGATVAILIMNIARPLIEKLTMPAYFGKLKAKKTEPAEAVTEVVEISPEETVEEVEEAVEITPEETAEEVEEAVKITPEETVEEVAETDEITPEETAEEVEEAVEITPEETVEEVEEAVEITPEETVEEVEEVIEITPEETVEEVEEAVEISPEETAEEVEEAVEITPEETAEEVEEVVEIVPEETAEEVKEAVEITPEATVAEVEEAVEISPEETAEEVEEVVEIVPEETAEEVEEVVDIVPEETVKIKPSKPVKLVDDISAMETEEPVKSRLTARQGRKSAPSPMPYSRKKSKRGKATVPMTIDIDTPLPDVIPSFLKKDIEKNKESSQKH